MKRVSFWQAEAAERMQDQLRATRDRCVHLREENAALKRENAELRAALAEEPTAEELDIAEIEEMVHIFETAAEVLRRSIHTDAAH